MRKPILIIIISVLLTAAFTAARYAVFERKLATASYGMRAICHESRISTLFIGSSMFRKGIYSPAVDADAYLLAYNGNQPAYEALELRWMLSNGANIERIVVDMYPYSAVRPAALSDTRMVMDGDFGYTLDVFHRVGDAKQRSFAALYKLLVQSNNETFVTFPLTFPLVNARYNHGANNADHPGATRVELDNAEAEEMQTLQTDLHPDQIEGLRDIISLCRQYDIPLFFVESPKYHRVYSDPAFIQIMRNYVTFLLNEEQPMLLCDATLRLLPDSLQNNLPAYGFPYDEPALFEDLIHLSGEGNKRFTQIVKSHLSL